MTRTASGAIPPNGYRLTLTATPVSLAANANSVLVAKVINNTTGGDAAGVTVTFDLPTALNKSGATLTDISATTDAQGYAIATYTAGNNTPGLSIQDVVTASVTGSAGAAIITRLPNVGTGNRIISFTEDPETSTGTPLTPPWVNVIMEVTVTSDDLGTKVEGKEVIFSIILGDGTITDAALPTHNTAEAGDPGLTVLTDDQGKAFVTFTRPASGSGDTVVRAQILGTTNVGDAARIVYWTDVTP